jgi:hypothetical protein
MCFVAFAFTGYRWAKIAPFNAARRMSLLPAAPGAKRLGTLALYFGKE